MSLKNIFTKIGNVTLGEASRVMPDRTKRLVFLASLAGYLSTQSKKRDAELLHKLNTVLELSNDDNAIELPFYFNRVIWHGQEMYDVFHVSKDALVTSTLDNTTDVVAHIISKMPKWLQYGTAAEVKKDIEQLLCNANIFCAV